MSIISRYRQLAEQYLLGAGWVKRCDLRTWLLNQITSEDGCRYREQVIVSMKKQPKPAKTLSAKIALGRERILRVVLDRLKRSSRIEVDREMYRLRLSTSDLLAVKGIIRDLGHRSPIYREAVVFKIEHTLPRPWLCTQAEIHGKACNDGPKNIRLGAEMIYQDALHCLGYAERQDRHGDLIVVKEGLAGRLRVRRGSPPRQ